MVGFLIHSYLRHPSPKLIPHSSWKTFFASVQVLLQDGDDDNVLLNKHLPALTNILGDINKHHCFPATALWQGCIISKPTSTTPHISPNIFCLLIWELYKVNFRFEFKGLDCCLVPEQWPSDSAHSTGSELVNAVFPYQLEVFQSPMASDDAGLCHQNSQQRLPYILAFCTVLQRWPAYPASCDQFKAPTTGDINPPLQRALLRLEEDLAQFYCQSFVKVFQVAPHLPHRFPDIA